MFHHLMMEKPGSVLTSCGLLFFFLFLQHGVSYKEIKSLPGFEGPLTFELETGYVGVGGSDDLQLFYYFFKSERTPKEDPLMIWLTGGPGCSGITGPVLETGPLSFKLEYNGSLPSLETTQDSWTKVSSIIFVDSPVGTGFSYSKNRLAFQSSDSTQVEHLDQFLRKWLVDHPDFLSNPFYVGGDSYSGMTVPAVVQRILDGNEQGVEPTINLQGYVLGNPLTEQRFESNYRIPFAHGMALISDELYMSLHKNCREEYHTVDPNNSACLKDLKYFDECVSDIFSWHILKHECEVPTIKLYDDTKHDQRRFLEELLSISPDCIGYTYWLCNLWANDDSVREALGVRKGSIGRWTRCNYSLPYTYDIKSSFPYHVNLSTKGLRSLVYSGDHDMTVPYLGTQAWIRALNYSIVDDWRPWMIHDQVAGYTRTYANRMTFATIKGGGHTAEYSRPECSVMFDRWITGHSL